ncbi:MAG: periplasmic heavy metal sensor [Bacteroidota bacterium]
MKTRILSIFIVAILISTTSMAQNPEWRKPNPEQKEMMLKRHKQLKEKHQNFFTEEQKEAMKQLRLETAKQVKPLKNELRELKAKRQTLTTADDADLKAINKNIDKMAELRAEIQKIVAKQHQEVRAMLTEEQLLKFDAMRGHLGNRPDSKIRRHRM